jgi:hypothetical protein
MGAAWATVASYWAGWVLVLLPFQKTRQILAVGLRSLIPLTLIAAAICGCVFLLPMNAWGRLGIAVVAYSGLVLICGFVRREDFLSLGVSWRNFTGWKGD